MDGRFARVKPILGELMSKVPRVEKLGCYDPAAFKQLGLQAICGAYFEITRVTARFK